MQRNMESRSAAIIQKENLEKVLSRHEPTTWKIIIFDGYNRSMLSWQLKMKDLRDHNITLYLSITEPRQQLHGVTIIYLVQPTLQNVQQIAQDLLADLYSSVVVHFSSQPSTQILSTLAKSITTKKPNLISRITHIQYSCIGYFCIDHQMYVLPSEVEIANLFMAIQYQPIFIYNGGDQQLKELVERVRGRLDDKKQMLERYPYAILYLYNRENDHFPLLSHGITYASLLQNLYEVSNLGNKITKPSEKVAYDLSVTDHIWLSKKNMLISEMQLQKQFNHVKSKMQNLSQDQFSEFNEKSKKIQWHVDSARDLLSQGGKRRLKEFEELEMDIYGKKALGKEQQKDFISLLEDKNVHDDDKIRLMMIYLLLCQHVDQLEKLQAAFPGVKKNGKYNEMKVKKLKEGSGGGRTSGKYLKKLAKGLWTNLVAAERKFPLSKDIQKIKKSEFSELRDIGLTVQSLYPLPPNLRIAQTIAYCFGGMCFHEYSNVIEHHPDIIYTGTGLINFSRVI